MNWVSIANMALFAVLIILATAATATLVGLDRWMDDRRERRDMDRFDVFMDGDWR